MQNINILIVYHKKARLIGGEDFIAVNAGRKICSESEREWLEKNTVGDDTGENISEKNRSYNELTAVYWAWKNLDSDYYGLMHYRRHFIFKDGKKPYSSTRKIGKNYFEKINYTPENLRDILGKYDFIAPMPMKRKSVYDHYKNAHDASDLDFVIAIIKLKFPEYAAACDKYIFGGDCYFYNMFVFCKADFDRYCRFVFGVLALCEKRFENKRMYVSERLTGIFITKLISDGEAGKFLPTMYVSAKPSLKAAVAETRKNLAERRISRGGIKSLVYAFKPLLLIFVPEFIFRIYRNRK